MTKAKKIKVTTIEGLAGMIVDFREDVDSRFEKIDSRFEQIEERFASLESETRNGFEETRRILDRIETRLTNLEAAVFGPTTSDGGRVVSDSILARLAKLERAVYKK